MSAADKNKQNEGSLPYKRMLVGLGIFILLTIFAGLTYKYFYYSTMDIDVHSVNTELSTASSVLSSGFSVDSGSQTISISLTGGREELLGGLSLPVKPTQVRLNYKYSVQFNITKESPLSLAASDKGFVLHLPQGQISSIIIDWASIQIEPELSKEDRDLFIANTKDSLTLYLESIIQTSLKSNSDIVSHAVIEQLSKNFDSFKQLSKSQFISIQMDVDQGDELEEKN